MTRRYLGAWLCALLAVVACILGGCSGKTSGADADAARACVEEQLSDVATLDPDARQLVCDELESHAGRQLQKMGVTADELVDDYFRDFSYEVGQATVTGNSAQVSVRVTCRSVRDVVTGLVERCKSKWEGAAPVLWELLDGEQPQAFDLTVSCAKGQDGTWSCKDGLTSALTKLCLK